MFGASYFGQAFFGQPYPGVTVPPVPPRDITVTVTAVVGRSFALTLAPDRWTVEATS